MVSRPTAESRIKGPRWRIGQRRDAPRTPGELRTETVAAGPPQTAADSLKKPRKVVQRMGSTSRYALLRSTQSPKDVGEWCMARGCVNRERLNFRYCLSDLCLFRIGFNASLQPLPFDPKAEPRKLPLPHPEFPDGIDVVVRSGALLPHRLPPIHSNKSGICYVRNQTSNYYIDLRGTFDDYLKGFSSKTRSTLSRKVRNVSMTMECRCFRTPDEVVDFHKLAREVAVETYQEKLFDGAIPASADFVVKMRTLAERDCFRGYTLSSNGKPVSYLYLPIENEVLIYGYLGYNPTYANLSVGTVLLYMAIEQVFAERRFRYFDFTHGEGQNKKLFGRASFLRGDFYFFRWSVRNALAVYGHFLMDWLSEALGRTFDVLGLRQRIRKLLRRA